MKFKLVSDNFDEDFIRVSVENREFCIYRPLGSGDTWFPEEKLAEMLFEAELNAQAVVAAIRKNGAFDSDSLDEFSEEYTAARREVFLQPFKGENVGRVSVWDGKEFVDYILRSSSKAELRSRCRKLLREKQTTRTDGKMGEDVPGYEIDYADGTREFDVCGVDSKGKFYWWN